MKLITETHADHIRGVLSCYDRIIIQGTLQPFCYAEGMTSFLYKHKIRIFDYKQHFVCLCGFPSVSKSLVMATTGWHPCYPRIQYQMMDNAFIDIENFEKAQAIADAFSPDLLHTILDDFARTYCPLLTVSS